MGCSAGGGLPPHAPIASAVNKIPKDATARAVVGICMAMLSVEKLPRYASASRWRQ